MRIGIVAQQSGEIFGIHEDYFNWVEQFGIPVMISPVDIKSFNSTYHVDGLVLPGGADVDRRRYSMLPSILSGTPNRFLEHFDTQILPQLIGKLPIFGICRGLQTLNVVLGGSLKQHLWGHPISAHKEDCVHGAWKIENFSKKNGKPEFRVNSFHHQAIGRLASDVRVELVANDGNIEAISGNMFHAVQWHPERILDDYSYEMASELFS